MSEGGEIIMPVPKAEAVSMAEVHAMRQVADSMRVLSDVVINQGKAQVEQAAASTRAMERLADKVDDMNTRLIRLEEAKHGREIERVENLAKEMAGRVDALEVTRDKQAGALGATGWVAKYAPGLLAICAAALAWLGYERATP